jgi:hypothetical protein
LPTQSHSHIPLKNGKKELPILSREFIQTLTQPVHRKVLNHHLFWIATLIGIYTRSCLTVNQRIQAVENDACLFSGFLVSVELFLLTIKKSANFCNLLSSMLLLGRPFRTCKSSRDLLEFEFDWANQIQESRITCIIHQRLFIGCHPP